MLRLVFWLEFIIVIINGSDVGGYVTDDEDDLPRYHDIIQRQITQMSQLSQHEQQAQPFIPYQAITTNSPTVSPIIIADIDEIDATPEITRQEWYKFKSKLQPYKDAVQKKKYEEPQNIPRCTKPELLSLFRKIKKGENLSMTLERTVQYMTNNIVHGGGYKNGEHNIGTYGLLLFGLQSLLFKHGYGGWYRIKQIGYESAPYVKYLFDLMLSDREFINADDHNKVIVLNRFLNYYCDIGHQKGLNTLWHMMLRRGNNLPKPDIFSVNIMLKDERYRMTKPLQKIDKICDIVDQLGIQFDHFTYNEVIWIYGQLLNNVYTNTQEYQNMLQRIRMMVNHYVKYNHIDTAVLKTIVRIYDKMWIKFTQKQFKEIITNLRAQDLQF